MVITVALLILLATVGCPWRTVSGGRPTTSGRRNTARLIRPKMHRASSSYTTTCNCSWTQERGNAFRVVGGIELSKDETFPMVAGLAHSSGCIHCVASILTEVHVLTAAHCAIGDRRIFLSAGRRNRCKRKNDGGQFIELHKKKYIHERFNEETNQFDIAILVTKSKINFNDQVGPTCLPMEPFDNKGDPIWILGWGKVSEGGAPGAVIQKVDVQLEDMNRCKKKLPKIWINSDESTQLCTYSMNKDACKGDSGAPLFWQDVRVGKLVQVALVSMGIGCARPNTPSINTAIYPFLDWINKIIASTWEKSSKTFIGDSNPKKEICRVVPTIY